MEKSLRGTLFASHALLVAPLVLALIVSTVMVGVSSRQSEQATVAEATRGRAADEMEINFLGIGFATHSYLRDHNPVHLDRVRKDTDDFELALAEYRELAADDQTRRWADRAEGFFREYMSLVRQLIENEDQLALRSADFLLAHSALQEKVESAEDAAAAGKKHPAGWATPLGLFDEQLEGLSRILLELVVLKTTPKRSIADTSGECDRLTGVLRGLAVADEDRDVLDAIRADLFGCLAAATAVEDLTRTRRALAEKKLPIRQEMDNLLDDEIQFAVARAQDDARSSRDAAVRLNFWILIVFGAVGIVAVLWVARRTADRMAAPVRDLVRATAALANGDFGGVVKPGPMRELNVLARSFNAMAATLAGAQADLRAANAALEAKVGELVGVNEALGRESAARETAQLQFFEAQKMEVAGRLAGGVAHDFNNLMTVVNGCCFRLEQMADRDPEARDLIDTIEEITRDAATITRQLLALSRHRVADPRPVCLNAVLERMRDTNFHMIEEDVECRLDLTANVGRVLADDGQLEQVVLNLVFNARDAMPTGGRITVSTRRWDEPTDPGRVWVCLAVEDTGHGMPDDVKARVFEPFYTTKGTGKGTGLGLAVVKGVVERAGGRIVVDSHPGVGTRFTLCFPVVDVECPPATPPVPPPVPPRTVLVVEDDDRIRANAVAALRAEGYAVCEAADAVQGGRVAGSLGGDLDVLVTDIVMPGPTGWRLAAELAAAIPGLRVVVTSGFSDRDEASDGPLGFTYSWLPKPYTADALLAAVAAGPPARPNGGQGAAASGGVPPSPAMA